MDSYGTVIYNVFLASHPPIFYFTILKDTKGQFTEE